MITLSNLTNVCLFSTKDRKYLSGVMKQENEVTILDLNLRKLGKKTRESIV